jgi:hypothetical protein
LQAKGRRRADYRRRRLAGRLAGGAQQGAPVRQNRKHTHGEEEEEMGNLTRGSEGKGKDQRQ